MARLVGRMRGRRAAEAAGGIPGRAAMPIGAEGEDPRRRARRSTAPAPPRPPQPATPTTRLATTPWMTLPVTSAICRLTPSLNTRSFEKLIRAKLVALLS